MSATLTNPTQTKNALAELEETFTPIIGIGGRVVVLEELAKRLSVIAHKTPPWSWRYIQGILTGSIVPSAKITRAILALGATMDGMPAIVAKTEAIQVFAEPGRVKSGSIILASSRMCARPACPISYVPVVPRQKYCCRECARKARQEIQQTERKRL